MKILLSNSERLFFQELERNVHFLDGYDISLDYSDYDSELYSEFESFGIIEISYPWAGFLRITRGVNWEKISSEEDCEEN